MSRDFEHLIDLSTFFFSNSSHISPLLKHGPSALSNIYYFPKTDLKMVTVTSTWRGNFSSFHFFGQINAYLKLRNKWK